MIQKSVRYIILTLTLTASLLSTLSAQKIQFRNLKVNPVVITPEKNTGLEAVYVLPTLHNVEAVYSASSSTAPVTWSRFSNLGGGYAEEIAGISHNGTEWILSDLQPDMGYIIDEGSSRYCFWVVDIQEHPLDLTALNIAAEQECDVTCLDLIGSADKITYYTVTGRGVELDRELTLSYQTMEYDSDSKDYREIATEVKLSSVTSLIHVPAPLCDTYFTLAGDRFAKAWGEEQSVESPLFVTTAVDAVCSAEQTERETANEQNSGSAADALGGSAPAEITFSAAVTPAAIFTEWQMSKDSEFEDIVSRYSETRFTYTFTEMGNMFVRFMAADASGKCEYYSQTYTVNIGESRLDCPNAFSPGVSEGINDEWKVSYKSLIRFECHIFNRYGQKMAEFTDPSQGWDGKYHGKLVPAGVYYYVIKATGSDGKKYDLSGDINIVNYR